ncbi:MAG: site-specific DNA-methyltransferase [Bacteroidales bacterium]|nr:site-specific DNA-methyltransferase [Bacteroidales bacterium]MCM1147448.1 site-specific DNA-methyltransferase [Bacteroidales bacterium]MCM1206117.1 site-specific DNA-methyltransferase [Bacillota bacterium]MCM1510052.1 site-specific DNA-methyltransferase [Clostridium sp.]
MKQRAPRNKTITIQSDERQGLRDRLVTAEALRNGCDWTDCIINEDIHDVLPLLPKAFADLIIIDPPYNLSRKFGKQYFSKKTEEEYESYLRSWLPTVCRKLKNDGSLYLCGDWHCTSILQRVLAENLHIINRITWQRDKGRGANANWKNSMEDIWFAVKDPDNYHFNLDAVKMRRIVKAPYKTDGKPKDWHQNRDGRFRDTCPGNFWDDISIPFWSMPENTEHPTQKPEKLYAKLILASSKEGDVIFDPFLGSGTSAVVAKKLGRNFVGCEIEEEFCLVAQKRLNLAEENRTIQGYKDGVFWERNSQPYQ